MREFLRGVADLGRGFRLWAADPRSMLLGAIPAVLVGAVEVGLLVALATLLEPIARWLTPFADDGTAGAAALRIVVAAAVLAAACLLAVLTFTAAVLAVGDPFYERISRRTEERLGDPPASEERGWVRGVLRAVRDGTVLLLASIVVAVVAFAIGLIPVAGPVLALVFGALIGGWFLALELTGTPFDARGHRLRERRRTLAGSRARVLGFGAATWLVLLVPFAAVVAMPAAVAGAAVLARAALEREAAGTGTGRPRTDGPG